MIACEENKCDGKNGAHEGFEANGPDGCHRQEVEWKDNLLDEILVREDDGGSLAHGFGDKAHYGQADKNPERVIEGTGIISHLEVAAHDHAEYESIEAEHQQWIDKDPERAEPASLGLPLDLAACETK